MHLSHTFFLLSKVGTMVKIIITFLFLSAHYSYTKYLLKCYKYKFYLSKLTINLNVFTRPLGFCQWMQTFFSSFFKFIGSISLWNSEDKRPLIKVTHPISPNKKVNYRFSFKPANRIVFSADIVNSIKQKRYKLNCYILIIRK